MAPFFESIKKFFKKKPSINESFRMCSEAFEELNANESQLRDEIEILSHKEQKLLNANQFEQNIRHKMLILKELATTQRRIKAKEKALENLIILQARILTTQKDITKRISKKSQHKDQIPYEGAGSILSVEEENDEEFQRWNTIIEDVAVKLSALQRQDSNGSLPSIMDHSSPKR